MGRDGMLVVDDDLPFCNVIAKFFAKRDFEVHKAFSGEEALNLLSRTKVRVMLCDVRMPGMSGLDLVPRALEMSPDLAILMISGDTDTTTAALCMQRGAVDYITKPFVLDDLASAVERALIRQERLIVAKEVFTDRQNAIQNERRLLEKSCIAAFEALVSTYEAKVPHLRGHSARVAGLATAIAQELGMSDQDIEQVREAGRLHDLGEMGIREEVLIKPGPLTPQEFDQVKHHVVIGSEILSRLAYVGEATSYGRSVEEGSRNLAWLSNLSHVSSFIRSHHEAWDGTGYPDGLSGEAIPIGGRILHAAEVYDAMTTARPYQERVSEAAAIAEIGESSGRELDPQVCRALTAVIQKRSAAVVG